uniref:Rho GTPase activating protein 27 n=1 Tax=Gouania willdenowi TaxID=441366 RepID=A0A8C5GCZ8_GOUWI
IVTVFFFSVVFRKNWTQNWSVLHGGVLTFHKDPKPATTGSLVRVAIVPEVAVDLRGATIGWATKDKSSKKNVLELKGKNGVEFLIQYDTESIISDWHKALNTEYEKMGSLDRDEKPAATMDRRRGNSSTFSFTASALTGPSRPSLGPSESPNRNSSTSSASTTTTTAPDNDPKKVRTKLMKFLMKRPTLQSVKEKGYIRDNVFGCHLATLCAFEKTTVPSFVEKCIKAVERRGLDIDGLYRVSGNLAVIQKLRFKADHARVCITPRAVFTVVQTEELDLEDGQWEDVHVLTGALKLFFRELPEPLFPYRFTDYNVKRSRFYELVHGLPPPNHDTMKLLFEHLHRVIEYGEDNRMTVQNVAIVFGPTLLRPENESSNIAMHMVFQNQIVEFILNEYEHIFK